MSTWPSRKTTPAATSIAWRGMTDETGEVRPQPVARSVIPRAFHSTPDALVNPSVPFHFPRIKQVSSIEKNRVRHRFAGTLEVQFLELRPLSGDHQRVTAFGHGVHVGHKSRALQNRLGLLHRFRVV